jgi:DNA-3-methyladenine glycosylase II
MHEFRLTPPAPYDFGKTAAFLSSGPDDVVDVFDGKRYTRLLEVHGRMRLALISSLGTQQRPDLIVTLMNGTERDEHGVMTVLTRVLGLSFEPQAFFKLCRQDQILYGLSSDHFGLRPAQRLHPFEALVTAIAAYHRGTHVLRTGLSDLATAFSYRVAYAGDTFFAFPSARVLAKQKPEDFVGVGEGTALAADLHTLAVGVTTGRIDLVGVARAPLDVMLEQLETLPGIDRHGAEFAAMMGYGRLDCFPCADPLIRAWIARNYFDAESIDELQATKWAERWGRCSSLVALHIYAELAKKGRF